MGSLQGEMEEWDQPLHHAPTHSPSITYLPPWQKHDFKSISEFKGHSLPYITTHTDLVVRQRAAVEAKKARVGVTNDAEWSGDKFVDQSSGLAAN
jgi:hypothetical protein